MLVSRKESFQGSGYSAIKQSKIAFLTGFNDTIMTNSRELLELILFLSAQSYALKTTSYEKIKRIP